MYVWLMVRTVCVCMVNGKDCVCVCMVIKDWSIFLMLLCSIRNESWWEEKDCSSSL